MLVVRTPSGSESRLRLEHFPFRIGRQSDNDLVLRDNRASRYHAQIVCSENVCIIEDLKSSYGVFVNGIRVPRAQLAPGDRIEFGVPDSYRLTYELIAESAPVTSAATSGLAKLRATLEVARALQSSLSIEDVLGTVVEAALTITGCERGFLLLRHGDDLDIRVARSSSGPLSKSDLSIPTRLLLHALNHRRELLSMNFDPHAEAASGAEMSVYNLELRSVVCVPLVRVRAGQVDRTSVLSPADDTVGLLYMDSRLSTADLSSGGRELLTTLALEASTVLENARLLEQQWARQRMQQELLIARQIQESLLPRLLPETGWFRAAVSSIPSLEVGGDYVDLLEINPDCWAAVMVDVSGKGVGAAILASLLQGMFVASPFARLSIEEMVTRVNLYLNERTSGEQYATSFYCTLSRGGILHWVNAGHPPPLLLRADGSIEQLDATGTPLGLLEEGHYPEQTTKLAPGDKLVVYTDGVNEAQNPQHQFYGLERLRNAVREHRSADCRGVHQALRAELDAFTQGEPQRDDVTLAVFAYGE